MGDLELVARFGCRHTAHDPVVLGHERHALLLAPGHQGQRGGLHASGAAHVAQAPELGHREVAREHGAPDEVDELARLAGCGQVVVDGHEVLARKGMLELGLGERGVAGTHHGHVGVDLPHHGHGVGADELALAVEVGRDDDLVGLFGQVLERADDLLLGGLLHHGRPHEIGQARDLPALDVHAFFREGLAHLLEGRVRKRLGEVRRQDLTVLRDAEPALSALPLQLAGKVDGKDVAAQAHGDPLLALAGEAAHGRVVDLVLLRGETELLGYVLGGVGLLGDYKLHGLLGLLRAGCLDSAGQEVRPCVDALTGLG